MELAGLIVGIIGVSLAILLAIPGAWRGWRRRRPLRVEVTPHAHRDDAVFATVHNRSDVDLELAIGTLDTDDDRHVTLQDIRRLIPARYQAEPILLLRDELPEIGRARWRSITVVDAEQHNASGRIPAAIADRLRR